MPRWESATRGMRYDMKHFAKASSELSVFWVALFTHFVIGVSCGESVRGLARVFRLNGISIWPSGGIDRPSASRNSLATIE